MKKLIIVFACMIVMLSSCYHNPIERNTIVFNDKVEDVQKCLRDMQGLLSILPKSSTELNTNYYLKGSILYVNNSLVGAINEIKIDTVKAFSRFNYRQKQDFIFLSKRLKDNFISAGFFDYSLNTWLFEYRALPDEDYHDTREIVLLKRSDALQIESQAKILDRKNMMVLIAPKNAKIR